MLRRTNLLERCTPSYRHPETPFPPEPESEPMQTEAMRLAPAERQRRLSKGLCLYCGGGGHVISSCPTHPPRLLVSSIQPVPQNMSPLTIVVTLITPHSCDRITYTGDNLGPKPLK